MRTQFIPICHNPPALHYFFQTPGKGWGIFAGEDIAPGAFIIEYVGEIIDEATADARLEDCRRRGEGHYYLMEIDANQFIDARHKVRERGDI